MSTDLISLSGNFMPVASVDMLLQRRRAIKEFYDAVMVAGTDYGIIPGTKEATLLKPGAEKLCMLFGLIPRPVLFECVEDWTGEAHGGEPFFYYHYRMGLYRNDTLIVEAEASANSWEKKYRYREAQRKCPACGATAIRKDNTTNGFYCWAKQGGCGAQFAPNYPEIVNQVLGRIPNPDIADEVNTLQKMAQKRALIAAILLATGASEFFSMDVEGDERAANGARQAPANDNQAAPRTNGKQKPANGTASSAKVINDSTAPCTECHAPSGKLHANGCSVAALIAQAEARATPVAPVEDETNEDDDQPILDAQINAIISLAEKLGDDIPDMTDWTYGQAKEHLSKLQTRRAVQR